MTHPLIVVSPMCTEPSILAVQGLWCLLYVMFQRRQDLVSFFFFLIWDFMKPTLTSGSGVCVIMAIQTLHSFSISLILPLIPAPLLLP